MHVKMYVKIDKGDEEEWNVIVKVGTYVEMMFLDGA